MTPPTMAGTFLFLPFPRMASSGAELAEAVDRIVCDVTAADADDDGTVDDGAVDDGAVDDGAVDDVVVDNKVVEAEASETAVISLLVPTTVLRGLPLTALRTYWPADGNVTETVPYWSSAFILKFANANPTSDKPCTNRRSKSMVMGSEASRVQRTKEDPPTMV